MTDRRSFIGGSAALAAVATAGAGRAGTLPRAGRFYKVVVDSRFAESVAFAREAARSGVALARISGDVTDLWFNDLDLRWKAGPVAVAGLTGADSLFCLERLGWDAGLRVVFRGEHLANASGGLDHRLTAPRGLLAGLGDASLGSELWPREAARLALACPFERAGGTAVRGSTCAAPSHGPGLVSWVIAPVQRA